MRPSSVAFHMGLPAAGPRIPLSGTLSGMMLRVAVLVFVFGVVPNSYAQTTQPPGAHADAMGEPGMHHAGTQDNAKPAPKPSSSLLVIGPAQSITLSLADLQAMPQTTVKVHNGHTNADETYSGPRLSEVLAKVGLSLTPKNEHDFLRMYIVARGTDGYYVLYSGAEVEPGLHKAEVIVAIAQDGQPLTRTGAFQLIDSLDVKPARWVRNLSKISVTTELLDAGAGS